MIDLVDEDIYEIINDNDPLLKMISAPVTEFNSDLLNIVQRLTATMIACHGRGLAAIQVGIAKRVLVAYADKTMYVMINPIITRTLNRETVETEGCLSIPGYTRKVSRPAKCDITWQDVKGVEHKGSFSKESARVLQHEIDHLNGILITDKPSVV